MKERWYFRGRRSLTSKGDEKEKQFISKNLQYRKSDACGFYCQKRKT